ncbi:hypothetical protein H5410_011375 [Solanum commersonii]|uniref:Uncharacterized protein n=1 Tax=Solanum commersonii TaxID=4109 RepID=A0A9J6ANF9_SOLCO|nr:hypothetical protein H5410_011375 [Solanum commersonii]
MELDVPGLVACPKEGLSDPINYVSRSTLARESGLPLLNPFKYRSANFRHGVNFAVAGATALSNEIMADKRFLINLPIVHKVCNLIGCLPIAPLAIN